MLSAIVTEVLKPKMQQIENVHYIIFDLCV